jgi:hypothetical protein
VWKCRDYKHNTLVAIKTVKLRAGSKVAQYEAELLRSVQSDYVVKLIDDFKVSET